VERPPLLALWCRIVTQEGTASVMLTPERPGHSLDMLATGIDGQRVATMLAAQERCRRGHAHNQFDRLPLRQPVIGLHVCVGPGTLLVRQRRFAVPSKLSLRPHQRPVAWSTLFV